MNVGLLTIDGILIVIAAWLCIGMAGIAAAITDAVHHATGVRVRELPVKIEDLLA